LTAKRWRARFERLVLAGWQTNGLADAGLFGIVLTLSTGYKLVNGTDESVEEAILSLFEMHSILLHCYALNLTTKNLLKIIDFLAYEP
jgi:hypothetical protein